MSIAISAQQKKKVDSKTFRGEDSLNDVVGIKKKINKNSTMMIANERQEFLDTTFYHSYIKLFFSCFCAIYNVCRLLRDVFFLLVWEYLGRSQIIARITKLN